MKEEPNNGGFLEVRWSDESEHRQKLQKPTRITGQARQELGKQLMIKGVNRIKCEHVLFNRENNEMDGS
jgi:hypothetical protein